MTPLVFISYSRETGTSDARRLCADLAIQFGPEQVLLAPEQDAGGVPACTVVVALIAPGWQCERDGFTQDLERAFASHLPVIAVRTARATLPPREQTPDALRPLLDSDPRLSIEIPSEFYWDVTVSQLARWLRAIGEQERRRAKAVAAASERRRRIEGDLAKGAERLRDAEAAATEARSRHATLETAVQAAVAAAVARDREVDPARVAPGLRVYLSYRASTGGDVRTLERDLRERVPAVRLSGSEAIAPDADAATLIAERIARADVVVVVIGPDWLGLAVERAVDPARLEVLAALRRAIPVIPVLTAHARLPDRSAMPDDLVGLLDQTPFELLVAFWEDGVAQLASRLGEIESDLRRRMAARDDAQARQGKLEQDLGKARGRQDAADTAIRSAREHIAARERELAQANDELERLAAERPDQNRAFLDGPGEIGPDSRGRRPGRVALMPTPSSRVLAAGIAMVVFIVLVVVLSR